MGKGYSILNTFKQVQVDDDEIRKKSDILCKALVDPLKMQHELDKKEFEILIRNEMLKNYGFAINVVAVGLGIMRDPIHIRPAHIKTEKLKSFLDNHSSHALTFNISNCDIDTKVKGKIPYYYPTIQLTRKQTDSS